MITDNYIIMCEQAEEIQKAWKPEKGDIYTTVVHGKATDIINIYIDGFSFLPQKFVPLSALYIYLPTQEQLQEMIKPTHGVDDFGLVEEFFDFVYGEDSQPNQIDSPIKSMNEFWLAFVMHEKYNKIWNGEKWEAVKE